MKKMPLLGGKETVKAENLRDNIMTRLTSNKNEGRFVGGENMEKLN